MQWSAVGNCRGCKLDKQHPNMFNICHSNWCLQSTEGVKKSDSDTIKTSTGPLCMKLLLASKTAVSVQNILSEIVVVIVAKSLRCLFELDSPGNG